MSIPSKEAWGAIQKDSLDEKHAYKQFFGLSLSQAQKKFEEHALFYQEDLYYMPPDVFSYYVDAYVNYITSEMAISDADGGSAFMSLVHWKLEEEQSVTGDDVLKKLIDVAELVSKKQDYYDADIDIYGSFGEVYKAIICLQNGA